MARDDASYIGLRGRQLPSGHGGPTVVGVREGESHRTLRKHPDARTLPDEFEWGYQGAGPDVLAEAILADRLGFNPDPPSSARSHARSFPGSSTSSSCPAGRSTSGSHAAAETLCANRGPLRPNPMTISANITCRLLGLSLAASVLACGESDAPPRQLETAKSPTSARQCLTAQGFQVTSGRRSPSDTNAPDTELIVGRDGFPGAFIAFYDDLARAKRYEPAIRKNSTRFGGRVKRRGRVTIAYVRRPRGNDGHPAVEECVF